jgi:urease accessory protein
MDSDTESYILLLLADGNLPTGSFVASSGLESFITHGFFDSQASSIANSEPRLPSAALANRAIINYITDNLGSYSHSALPFVSDAHTLAQNYSDYLQVLADDDHRETLAKALEQSTLQKLCSLDALYECMTLNDVSRRASTTQGVALLTLLAKGFCKPPHLALSAGSAEEESLFRLSDRLKAMIRKGETPGHLPICWGFLTAALNLSLGA